jgi:exodeoxyribonuclease V beta subunit
MRPPQALRLDVLQAPLDGVRLIEASAGTGKTWALCALVLRLLLERGLPVQQILVVTFTNAATAELRDRIRARLAEALAHLLGEAPPTPDTFISDLLAALLARGHDAAGLRAALEAALRGFDEASIFTIHGFCQRALADTPFSARLPLELELVADDSALRQEAVNDFWRRHFGAGAVDPALAAHLSRKKDSPDTFSLLLKRHLAKPLARALWPDGIEAATPADPAALQAAHEAARTLWQAEREQILARVREAMAADALPVKSYTDASLAAAAEEWDRLLACADPRHGLALKFEKLEHLGSTRLKAKKGREPFTPRHAFFDAAQHLIDQRAADLAPLQLRRLALLRTLLDEGGTALRDTKRRRRLVAFDDMLFNLHQRLQAPDGAALAATLHRRFPVALVDEFQDTDPLQFEVFRTMHAAGGEGALFFVGDPKQAIYSFRNADLHTYLEARKFAQAEYTLGDNQRSSAALIDALNALFSANPNAFMQQGLAYRRVGAGAKKRRTLVDRSGGAATPLQVWLLQGQDGAPATKKRARVDVVRATAAEVARLVGAARRGAVMLDDGAGRTPLRAGDIAVLVRSHAQGSEVRQALAALGLSSVEVSQSGIFASPDAEDLERLLAAILEPGREPLLKAALATGLLGLDAAAIEALADDAEALAQWVQTLARWRDAWRERGAGVLLRQLVAEAGVAQRLLARPDGERRMTNLLHLVECLQQAAADHPSPQALWRWFQGQRREDRRDDTTQLRLESDQNLVQIVTIHKAKGLEYGVVFCPFLWDGYPGAGETLDGVEYHDDAGHSVIDYRKDTLSKAELDARKARIRAEKAAESLRLVYVALTRAVHRCVLVAGGYLAGNGSPKESCRSVLNWLAAGGGHAGASWLTADTPVADIPRIESAWHTLAALHPEAISVKPMPATPGVPLTPEHPAPDSLAALAPPAHIPGAWRIGSYSSLVHGAHHEDAAIEHDQRAAGDADGIEDTVPIAEETAAAALHEDDILHFPRGSSAGDCLHALFEAIDFDQSAHWPEAIAHTLRAHRALLPADPAGSETPRRARMLARLLDDVMATPLPLGAGTPLRLATLPRTRVRKEMEFHLPAAAVDAAALNRLLADHGLAMPRLSFATLRGYLKGFIDLVFEHDGRYFIADWKSNHLGVRAADYGPAPLAAAMAAQGYHLQALLYAVALDRYLARRVAGYQRASHFGGAVYLFVRGLRPHWRNADGTPTGCHVHRPGDVLLDRLSALLDGAAAPGRRR